VVVVLRWFLVLRLTMGLSWSSQRRAPATPSSLRVWITGASSGLGEALALEYARRGEGKSKLVLSARREDRLAAVAKKCEGLGATCEVVPLDQGALQSASIDRALTAFDGVDVVVVNGGVSSRGNALDTDFETLRRVTEVNFLASAEIGRRAAQDMQVRGLNGRIVAVSSVQAFFGLPGRSAYGASKHALRGYFDSLRAEVAASGISVTVASPGYISTDLSRNALTADGSPYASTDATTAKGADPADVARAIISAADQRTSEIFVVPGLSARFATLLRTLSPSLLFWIMDKRAAAAATATKKTN